MITRELIENFRETVIPFEGDDTILVDKAEAQTELMMLPSVQKKEYSCDGCKFCGQFEYQFPYKVCIRREKDYYARPD